MKITLVNLCAPMTASDRPCLTPELLGSVGARYSRNNEGLQDILSKIDPNDPDRSVDQIFRYTDYGHNSIMDMVPIAMFMDGVSILLAFFLWNQCQLAAGQESSTRYIRFKPEYMLEPDETNLKKELVYKAQGDSFLCYEKSYNEWLEISLKHPEVMKIPKEIMDENDPKKIARIKRNYSFDRARVFLPVSAKTNVMMIQSAREWVSLISWLASHPALEFKKLGKMLKDELNLATPRLIKHAVPKTSNQAVIDYAIDHTFTLPAWKTEGDAGGFARVNNIISDEKKKNVIEAMKKRENRYCSFPYHIKDCSLSFGWVRGAFGDLRDLNRHRTGSRTLHLMPNGFYAATDMAQNEKQIKMLEGFANNEMYEAYNNCVKELNKGNFEGLYLLSLGHTFPYSHVTTLDKWAYEAELRTGPGAHYSYSRMMQQTIADISKWWPEFVDNLFIGNNQIESI